MRMRWARSSVWGPSQPPMTMFQSGRVKISGDLFFAAQLQGMFRIPA